MLNKQQIEWAADSVALAIGVALTSKCRQDYTKRMEERYKFWWGDFSIKAEGFLRGHVINEIRGMVSPSEDQATAHELMGLLDCAERVGSLMEKQGVATNEDGMIVLSDRIVDKVVSELREAVLDSGNPWQAPGIAYALAGIVMRLGCELGVSVAHENMDVDLYYEENRRGCCAMIAKDIGMLESYLFCVCSEEQFERVKEVTDAAMTILHTKATR